MSTAVPVERAETLPDRVMSEWPRFGEENVHPRRRQDLDGGQHAPIDLTGPDVIPTAAVEVDPRVRVDAGGDRRGADAQHAPSVLGEHAARPEQLPAVEDRVHRLPQPDADEVHQG